MALAIVMLVGVAPNARSHDWDCIDSQSGTEEVDFKVSQGNIWLEIDSTVIQLSMSLTIEFCDETERAYTFSEAYDDLEGHYTDLGGDGTNFRRKRIKRGLHGVGQDENGMTYPCQPGGWTCIRF